MLNLIIIILIIIIIIIIIIVIIIVIIVISIVDGEVIQQSFENSLFSAVNDVPFLFGNMG